MSRVAKNPITLPAGVEVIIEHEMMQVNGPKGTLKQHYNNLVLIERDAENSNVILFKRRTDHSKGSAQSGTARALMMNMVNGVTNGFKKTLELVGVGYKVQVSGDKLVLALGFSHPVEFELPTGITAEAPNNTTLIINGIDKQLVGQVAANIRALRKPEPYKGKGIRYAGEQIKRKEAKKK